VIEQAVAHAAELRDLGLDVPISVNLTPRDLLDKNLPTDIAAILGAHRLGGGALTVEITESATVVDMATSIRVLDRLRDQGVRVAIDDFGTGYSSLHYLHRLPVDELKIDQSFVADMTIDSSALAIVKASVHLAHDLGLTTVAEGVESNRTHDQLLALGCQQMQGNNISRPLPPDQFLAWMVDWNTHLLTSGAILEPRVAD
jgi:EAL domain-containing protein (putative c-di-GMP-specific phosphodiesterase class I)